jgi:hypothetical protein
MTGPQCPRIGTTISFCLILCFIRLESKIMIWTSVDFDTLLIYIARESLAISRFSLA